jgi:signal transduction histidine kinase
MRSSVQEIARRLGARREARATDAARERGGRSDAGDSGPEALLEIVLSESDRLDAIISDFLAFAKMRPARKGDCDVGAVVEEVALMLRQAPSPGTEVEVVTELDGAPRCRADAQQLRQVLLNLGLNGIDAVQERTDARIVFRARPCALLDFPLGAAPVPPVRAVGERAGVQVDVQDNGCGMAEDARRRALDPFFTQKERGTGLGLAIADRIIKAHEGAISIESREGEGTCVSVWLPVEG